MEVHHHTHSARKKWTHYFWEFLMLFLAVFCGFLAEYQLEHTIEHQRETKFMRSMIEDLQKDTSEIKYWIGRLEFNKDRIDSAIWIYASNKKLDPVQVATIGHWGISGTSSMNIAFTDRTSSQLKNSGGMRLIRNSLVADAITDYWNLMEGYLLTHFRMENYRIDTRKLGSKIFGFIPGSYVKKTLDSNFVYDNYRLLDNSPLLLGEYVNNLELLGTIIRSSYLSQMENLYQLATRIIEMIKKEYRLK